MITPKLLEMLLVQWDDVIEYFAARAPDPALGDSVLPGASSTGANGSNVWIAVSIYLLVVALRHPQQNDEDMWKCGKGRCFMSQTCKIITSVAFMRAAAVCPRFSCISLAERAVMIDVIC
jgi:hypothetical protein